MDEEKRDTYFVSELGLDFDASISGRTVSQKKGWV